MGLQATAAPAIVIVLGDLGLLRAAPASTASAWP